MTGLFLVWVNTQPPNYGRDYLKQDMKAAGQSFTGLLSASFSTLFLLVFTEAYFVFLLVENHFELDEVFL